MLQSVQSALRATHGQLADLFPRYGIQLRSQQIWQRLGATVMIGQNNIQGENFTVSDARGLVSFAGRKPPWPGLHVVAQPGQPVRFVVPGEWGALQHLQRHRTVRPASSPRPSAG